MARNARAGRDNVSFADVKAAANELSDRLKVAPALSAQSLPSLRPAAPTRACASGAGPDLSGIEAGLGLLIHAVRTNAEVSARVVRMSFAP
jgi:hypothetical protein